MNKALELALNGDKCLLTSKQLVPNYGNFTTYETEVLRRYIDEFIAKMIKACEQIKKAHINLLPASFLSAVIDDCMERGINLTAGGVKNFWTHCKRILRAMTSCTLVF